MKELTLEYDKYRINYVDSGEGKAMLFLHNGGGFWHIWKNQLEFFKKSHRVIAMDWVGFGNSSEADEALSIEFSYQVLRHFIQRLKLGDLIIVGNCIGASVALWYKQLHPGEVSHLVLLNICPGIRLVRSPMMRWLLFAKPDLPGRKRWLEAILRFLFTRTAIKHKFPRILFGRNYDPNDPLVIRYIEKFKEERQTKARLNLLFASDTYTLERIRDNTLDLGNCTLLWGSHNRVADFKKEAYFHQSKLGLDRIHVIEDGGHLACYEQPDQVNGIIEKHIRE